MKMIVKYRTYSFTVLLTYVVLCERIIKSIKNVYIQCCYLIQIIYLKAYAHVYILKFKIIMFNNYYCNNIILFIHNQV